MAILAHLHGVNHLMASLLYGDGLRLMECIRLRVKDVDFAYGQLTVRDGKGAGYTARLTRVKHRAGRLRAYGGCQPGGELLEQTQGFVQARGHRVELENESRGVRGDTISTPFLGVENLVSAAY